MCQLSTIIFLNNGIFTTSTHECHLAEPPLQRMVVGDSLLSPIPPHHQPQHRLVEGDNDIEMLHVQRWLSEDIKKTWWIIHFTFTFIFNTTLNNLIFSSGIFMGVMVNKGVRNWIPSIWQILKRLQRGSSLRYIFPWDSCSLYHSYLNLNRCRREQISRY